jgi:hypothetical protein
MKEFGIEGFDIPERNIHIVPPNLYKQIEEDSNRVAITIQDLQLILLNAEHLRHPIRRASTIFHEMIHLKNYLAIEAYDYLYKPYHIGLRISPSMRKQEKIGHFTAFLGLNEAVVSEIEKRYFPQLISGNEFLAEEYQWLTSEKARKYKKRIAESEGLPADEIMWVSKDGKHLGCFPYYEQRRVLNYIVDCLDEDNVEQFNSRDEIMKLF